MNSRHPILPGAAFLLLSLLVPLTQGADWIIENASGQRWFEKMKPDHLKVNVGERPCAAFGGDQLYYAERDPSGIWQVQTVDPSRAVGADASLELLNGRYPRISYFDRGRASLKYASWEQNGQGVWGWHLEMVDYSSPLGSQSSLALGNDGCKVPSFKDSPEVWPEVRHFVTAELRYRAGIDAEPVGLGDQVGDEHGGELVVARRHRMRPAIRSRCLAGTCRRGTLQSRRLRWRTGLISLHRSWL